MKSAKPGPAVTLTLPARIAESICHGLRQRHPRMTMRTIVALVALVLCLDVAAQPPTLKATADWLHDFIEVEGVVFHPDGNWIDRYHVSLTGCHVTILQENKDISCTKAKNKQACGPDFPYSTTYNFKREFDLKDIDPDRIEVQEVPFEKLIYSVNLTTTNERPLVDSFVKGGGITQFMKAFPEHDAYIAFGRSNRESAQRVAKALLHAATLCGGVASPF
jgi:hypothetical protein